MRMLSLCVVAALVVAVAGPADSSEVGPASISRIEKQLVPKLVSAVGELGNGRVEAALDAFQQIMGRQFQKTSGPFGQDEREVWRKMFILFPKSPPKFECVDLIGTQAISTQAFIITVVASGENGPIVFQFRAYEYRGKIRLVSVHFDSNWGRIESVVAAVGQKRFTRYPLTVEQTASKPKKTKRK